MEAFKAAAADTAAGAPVARKYYSFWYIIREEIVRADYCDCKYKETVSRCANYSPDETKEIEFALKNGASSVRLERTGTHRDNLGQKTWHNIDFTTMIVTNEKMVLFILSLYLINRVNQENVVLLATFLNRVLQN